MCDRCNVGKRGSLRSHYSTNDVYSRTWRTRRGEPETNLPSSCKKAPEKTPTPAALAVEEAPIEAAACTPSEQEETAEGEVRAMVPVVPVAAMEQPFAQLGRRRTESSASQGSVDMVEPGVQATRRNSKEMTVPRPTFLGKNHQETPVQPTCEYPIGKPEEGKGTTLIGKRIEPPKCLRKMLN